MRLFPHVRIACFAGRCKRYDPQANRAQQAVERFAHGGIVVDHQHARSYAPQETSLFVTTMKR
jgi:hypothetical protein